jgi:phage/plasmid-like protein (TIGR03299 family)
MVAAVTVKGKKAEMAYVGEKPWHGLGQSLTPNQPLEVWAKEAGMEWKVQRSKVRYATSADGAKKDDYREWGEQHVLFRSDTKAPLGLVSDGFKIVQPGEVLEFFRSLTEQNHFTLETAGTLFGGKRYWALAKTQHELVLNGKDRVGGYLLLATACDGSMATTGKFTSVRVVCNNTLTASLRDGKQAVKVRHSAVFSETEMKIELGVLDEAWKQFSENARKLTAAKMTKRDALDLLLNVLGDPAKLAIDTAALGREKALEAQPNMKGMATILEMFDGKARGADLPSAKGTAWGLVNAATEYYDHIYGRDQSRRLSKAWFGKNDGFKTDIMEAALVTVDR